ncbi:hypothetical protein KC360_g177 [Hortaea werneckii]|nr:hypothetical protein KC360_g177 [Hortaea werneckii]
MDATINSGTVMPWTLPLAPISKRDLTASSTIQLPGVPMWNCASQWSPFTCCSVAEIFRCASSEGAMDSEGVVFCTSSVSRRDLVTRRFDWRRPSAAGIQSLSGICQSRQLIGLVRPSPHGTIQLLIHRDLEKIIDNSPHHDHGRHVPVDGAIMAIHYEPFPPVYGHIPSGTGICADVIFFTVCAEIGVLLFSGCKNPWKCFTPTPLAIRDGEEDAAFPHRTARNPLLGHGGGGEGLGRAACEEEPIASGVCRVAMHDSNGEARGEEFRHGVVDEGIEVLCERLVCRPAYDVWVRKRRFSSIFMVCTGYHVAGVGRGKCFIIKATLGSRESQSNQ